MSQFSRASADGFGDSGGVIREGVIREGLQSRNKAGTSTAAVRAKDRDLLETLADGRHGTREGIHYDLLSHI